MLNNNHKQPDISLGKIVFTIDLDEGKYNIRVENEQTGQLTNAQEILNLFPATGITLFIEDIRRRERRIVVV